MMRDLAFAPLLPWPFLIALAAAATLIVLWGLAARSRGALLRLASFALLILALCGPSLIVKTTRALPDIAVILLDRSPSMQIGQRPALQAQALASLRRTAGATELRVVDVAPAQARGPPPPPPPPPPRPAAAGPPAEAGGTSLTAAAAAALAAIAPGQRAGVIAITDGELAGLPAMPQGVPFSALLPATGEETDRELHVLNAPSYGLVGQTAPFTFEVRDHGATGNAPATVTVMADNAPVATLPVSPDTPITVQVPISHAGPLLVTAHVTPLPGAVTNLNASTAFTLTGIHKRLNILLISGFPDQGERAWRVLLRSDPTVQSVHFTILRTPREAIGADERDLALVPFPVRELFEQDIGKFDLIILDGFDAEGVLPLPYLANIAAYVENGGALLAEVGPEFASPDSLAVSPLGQILPAEPAPPGTLTAPFAPTLTGIGTRDPVTAPFAAATLSPWFRQETAHATGGQVLMTGAQGDPLLILADTGKGRTGLLLSDQLWLWTRAAPHTGPALPLLRRIVHWLLREPSLEAESLTAHITGNTLQITRQTLSPTSPGPATITTADGLQKTTTLTEDAPGRYTASLPLPPAPGVTKVEEGGLTAFAASSPLNPQEFENLAATARIVAPHAQNIVWLGQTPTPALPSLIAPRHATQTLSTRRAPLLPPLPALALALALAAAAWWRERA